MTCLTCYESISQFNMKQLHQSLFNVCLLSGGMHTENKQMVGKHLPLIVSRKMSFKSCFGHCLGWILCSSTPTFGAPHFKSRDRDESTDFLGVLYEILVYHGVSIVQPDVFSQNCGPNKNQLVMLVSQFCLKISSTRSSWLLLRAKRHLAELTVTAGRHHDEQLFIRTWRCALSPSMGKKTYVSREKRYFMVFPWSPAKTSKEESRQISKKSDL